LSYSIPRALVFLLLLAGPVFADQHHLGPSSDAKKLCKTVRPGDSIVLKNGIWQDSELEFALSGTAEAPISVVAETPGKVIFQGKTELRFSGQHVVISGLVFRNSEGVDNVLEMRTDDEVKAENFRITECVFEQPADSISEKETTWLAVYGSNHRIDHCYFGGKKTRGATVVVWVSQKPEKHRIDHNFFGARPKLGENGGETLRIGTSKDSEFPCQTLVEDNYFYRCDGEAEIVSNKSCENIYRHNLFDECSGALTLRHGHRCLVDGNVFLGNERKGTGGIRIIGQGHRVINNYLEGLRGDKERAAIALMNGIPDGPLNGFAPVKDAVVAHNTLIDCKVTIEIGVGAGKKQTAAPADCVFANNVFSSGKWNPFRVHADPAGFRWTGNKQQTGRDYDDLLVEFDRVALQLRRQDDSLMRPTDAKKLETEKLTAMEIETDVDGQSRGETAIAGCDAPSSLREFPSPKNSGPDWWRDANKTEVFSEP